MIIRVSDPPVAKITESVWSRKGDFYIKRPAFLRSAAWKRTKGPIVRDILSWLNIAAHYVGIVICSCGIAINIAYVAYIGIDRWTYQIILSRRWRDDDRCRSLPFPKNWPGHLRDVIAFGIYGILFLFGGLNGIANKRERMVEAALEKKSHSFLKRWKIEVGKVWRINWVVVQCNKRFIYKSWS